MTPLLLRGWPHDDEGVVLEQEIQAVHAAGSATKSGQGLFLSSSPGGLPWKTCRATDPPAATHLHTSSPSKEDLFMTS
jgi:hypothetical protein